MYGDALTTKDRIKARLDITVTAFDTVLDNIILAVTARIEQMTGRRFLQATFTNELHDGSDFYGSFRTSLIVKNAPIQSIATIEYMAGTPSNPLWTAFFIDDYQVDYQAGLIHFFCNLPRGYQNIRITYTGGFSGYSIGINQLWHLNVTTPDIGGTVDGANLSFTLPENADQIIVYADGVRLLSSNVTHTDGTDTFTLAAGQAPATAIAVDYLASTASGGGSDNYLPADIVEVAEEAVSRIFKRRTSEGRSSETFESSSVTWNKTIFTDEDRATIKNYRRGYNL